jgi:hypothetical protein
MIGGPVGGRGIHPKSLILNKFQKWDRALTRIYYFGSASAYFNGS